MDTSVKELFFSLCVRTLHIPSFTGQEIRTLFLSHCLKGQSQIWKDTFPFQECFLAINIFIHFQVGYLHLWLFGAPYLIFSLSDVWRSCQNYYCTDYSTETVAKLIIYDSQGQWLISVCAQRRAYQQQYMKVLICTDMEIHRKSGISNVMALHSYWQEER